MSSQLEGVVLFCVLGVVIIMAIISMNIWQRNKSIGTRVIGTLLINVLLFGTGSIWWGFFATDGLSGGRMGYLWPFICPRKFGHDGRAL